MRSGRVSIRPATRRHAARLHALIAASQQEGHLLPRTLDEIAGRAERFVVAVSGRRILGCAELAPLSSQVAEVRSLVVVPAARGGGAGRLLVEELQRRGRAEGFDWLCAFTHAPAYFARFGFSVVPHSRLPEKISTDCVKCPLVGRCGQFAMVLPLDTVETVEHTRLQVIQS
jgi:amino-acid N-acetyltransferase